MTNSATPATSYSERSLRMTSMEKFHWLDRNPELPNFVFATLRFAVRIDPALARQALAFALSRQPLAAMEPKLIRGRWSWKPIPDIQLDSERFFDSRCLTDPEHKSDAAKSWLQCESQEYVSCFLSVIDVSKSTSSERTACEIQFHSHHAVSDGVASIGLVNDWLTVYYNLIAGLPAGNGLAEVEGSSFQKRGVLGLLSWNYFKSLPLQAIALFGAAKFIFRKTKSIAHETASIDTPAAYPAIRGAWIDAATLKADRLRATDNQIGFTAWCLAKYFVSIENWNQKRGSEADRESPTNSGSSQSKSTSVWRILLPISIRSAADRAAVAANRTAVVQIDRQPPTSRADLIPFSQSIDYEINFIRRWQLEKMFLIAIRLASLSNSWLAKIANNPVSRGAAVFTHLGRPLKRAMIHLDRLSNSVANPLLAAPIDFDMVGPIRTGTPLNISFARFDHRLKISLHHDSRVISTAEADRLLASIVNLFAAEVA